MMKEIFSRDIKVMKFSETTYSRWKIEIRNVLECCRIWEIADGFIQKSQEVTLME